MKKIIVAFHIGRGGRFYNPGFKSFIGEKSINDFTDDLFINYEYQYDLFKKIKGYSNLEEKYYECCDSDDFSFFENRLNFEMGEKVYTDCNGCFVGLTVKEAEEGVGCITIDYDYDTTYAKYLEDCTEEELDLIRNYDYYKSPLLLEYISEPEEEEEF